MTVEIEAVAEEARYRVIRRVTIVGALVNLLLAVGKVLLGIWGQSQALVADGIHSFSDLISDGVVLLAGKHGSRGADDAHPYGHGRIETVGTVLVGVLLVLAAGGIMVDAVARLLEPVRLLNPGIIALLGAAVSVAANEGLTRYTLAAARKIRSKLLEANAWHHRSDAASSLVVIVGVAGTMAGFESLDAVAAIVVALMIARMGINLIWDSTRELIDAGLEPDQVAKIRSLIEQAEGVRELHMLRTRRSGANALVDVHILVDPRVSVSEGHLIGESVRRLLIDRVEEINDVTVHIDPEDDETTPVSLDTPLRSEVEAQLRNVWLEYLPEQTELELTLHYLQGQICVELVLPLNCVDSINAAKELAAVLRTVGLKIDRVGEIKVQFH